MGIEEALAFIHATSWMGSKLGLERMHELMTKLGNPQNELRVIHVAGSNGKGSACAILSSILTTAGYKTGLYTSPHLIHVNERMKINGIDISDEYLVEIAAQVQMAVDAMGEKPTEFEIITAMAFLYFRQQRCDIVVLEVGLGGRLDATNVIPMPALTIIMNIGLEHTDVLGDTLQEIATEKAGIIKKTGTVIVYPQLPSVESVIEQICEERQAKLIKTNPEDINVRDETLEGQVFDWKKITGLKLKLLGRHQILNAAVVLTAIEQLNETGWIISEADIRKALVTAPWPARFEILSSAPLFILDGAHNPQCVEMLKQSIDTLLPEQKIVFVMGVLKDKDYLQMLKLISPRIKEIICLTPDSDRALPGESLASIVEGFELKATAFVNVERGIITALSAAKGRPVIAFGSLYLAGSIRDSFPSAFKKWQRKENIQIRDAMSESQRAARSQKIVQRIVESQEFSRAHTIMSYRAVKGEVNLEELDRIAIQANKNVVYPVCVSRTEMISLQPNDENSWRKSTFGILEPILERSTAVVPEDIDMVLCPCTAFDESCSRLGMGAGYYDRFLQQCKNATIAAVAFEQQRSPTVMIEPHDRKMELIFTDYCTYYRG